MRGLIRTAGFVGSLGLMAFWFAGINDHQVNAVDPPYVPPPPAGYVDWDDHLVDQQMAQLVTGDPNP